MDSQKGDDLMDSLEHGAAETLQIPRFDDGMVNIQELLRVVAEALVNEIMDAQAEDACADGNQRNGYRERTLVTSVGAINLRIPKLRRGSYFPEDLLVRYSRVDRAVIAAVSEMVTSGVSTRKVERVAQTLGIDRMSASQVSRDLRVAGRCRGRSAGPGPLRRGFSLHLGGRHLRQVPGGRPRVVLRARDGHRGR